MPRSIRLLLTLGALALLAPATAGAQSESTPTIIDGSPLNVAVMPDGRVQASVDGSQGGEFFSPTTFDPVSGDAIPNYAGGTAGFNVIVVDPSGSTSPQAFGNFLGIGSSYPAPSFGPQLTPGDPATIVTRWSVPDQNSGGPLFDLEKTVTYDDGTRQFDLRYTVTNTSEGPLVFRSNEAADLAIRGTDQGVGFLLGTAPTRFAGGLNQAVGAAGGLVEVTPWTHFETGGLGTVASHARDTSGPGFDDSVSTEDTDNAAGAQWDTFFTRASALGAGQTATFQVGWRFIDTLGLTPVSAEELTGNEHAVTVQVGDLSGTPQGNQTIHYTIAGANNLEGEVKTDTAGHARIAWIGGVPGQDILTAFVDLNGSKTRDENEAQAVATVDWTGPPAPVIGQSAGARPVTGTVKIKLPPGVSGAQAKRMGLHAAIGFQTLTQATQIPMGSVLDTSRGTVNLLTAASKNPFGGKFQSGNFNGGQFRLSQSRKNPLTQLSMQGAGLKTCNTRVPRGGSSARSRHRRLFGNAHGRFRTRGRNSSATVRGTKWTMTDTCNTTVTAVQRGTVIVRDFTLRKNKKLKRGQRYVARAPRGRLRK